MKIILDAAHGEDVPGKRSPDGQLREYKWSRETIAALIPMLAKEGIEAINIVKEVNEPGLSERVRRTNAIPGDKFFISLHINAAGNGAEWMKARGWSIWTTKGQTKSDAYATIFYKEFMKAFPEIPVRQDMTDGDPDWESNFAVLKCNCPAVLIETLFQDNLKDKELLMSEDFNKRYVQYLCSTIKKIVGK